jgi:hypothetical protein
MAGLTVLYTKVFTAGIIFPTQGHTIGYHRNYSGCWLVATMSASKSTSLMHDFTSCVDTAIFGAYFVIIFIC